MADQAIHTDSTEEKKSNFERLRPYAGGHFTLTIASLVLSGASALIALAPFVCLWHIIDGVIAAQGDVSAMEGLAVWGWWALALALLALLVYTAGLMCSHTAAFRIARNLRIALMQHVSTIPLGALERFGTGRLRKVIDESSGATETYLAHRLPDKAGAVVTPIGLIGLMLYFDWRLGLLCLVPVVLGFALMMLGMCGSTMKKKMVQYTDALEQMAGQAVEYVRGMPVVKTFGQTVFSFKRFKDSIDHYGTWALDYTRELRAPMTAYTTIVNSVFAVLIAAGLLLCQDGVDSVFLTNLIYYVIITPIITVTMNKIMFASEDGMIVEDAMDRIDEILNIEPLPQAQDPQVPTEYSLSFDDVVFSYDAEGAPVIRDVSIDVPQGTTLALVGPSGSGKSTLASLAARIWDVRGGSVSVGGVDVRNIADKDLMNLVSVVFQDSRLLKMSIADNVRLGKPDATDEQVTKALQDAQCADILQKFPQGINTLVGSKGVYLSGGEQQRIALARAFLKNAPVLVLDEATAFADPDNEALMSRALERLSKHCTVLKIAHRLSTVVNADNIAVVQDGRIKETGTHEQLLSSGGTYATMWEHYQLADGWALAKEGE